MTGRWMICLMASAIVGVVLILTGCGQVAERVSGPLEREVNLIVSGLPAEKELTVWAAAKTSIGSKYRRVQQLATIREQGWHTLVLPLGATAVEVLPIFECAYYECEHTRYASPSRYYDLEPGPNDLEITLTRQYRVELSSGTRYAQIPGEPQPGESGISVTPEGDAGYFDENSVITLEGIPARGLMFAWWAIKDGAELAKFEVSDFSTAANPAAIKVNGPKRISASFVGQWFRSTEKARPEWFEDRPEIRDTESTVYVRTLTAGQRVRLVDGDRVIGEALLSEGQTTAGIPVPKGATVRGAFHVTAPDGETVIFQSSTYDDISAGDVFDY